MSGYVSVNRLSLLQLLSEERKQQAHMKKIAEVQHRSRIDNSPPKACPHLRQGFAIQRKEKTRDITRENQTKSKKLLEIMSSKKNPPTLPFQRTTSKSRDSSVNLSLQTDPQLTERITKIKGTYDTRALEKDFQEHKQHLKIIKNNKLFTPRDIGVNRQRAKVLSTINSRRTTPGSSLVNVPK